MRYPLQLNFDGKYRIWGGERLKKDFEKQTDIDRLGETWELSVREDGMSTVSNGTYAGMSLSRAIAEMGYDCVSPDYKGGRFPLLIKLIDATDRLSVQVHPDDIYAAERENDLGKTEMWIILSADEGAELVYGLADGIGQSEFAQAVQAGEIEKTLATRPVKAGDVFFIPSGMVHAIGAGIVLAEIQQNSDLTYRVYDYNRYQNDGTLRELHVEKALDVVRPFTDAEINAIRYECRGEGDGDGENTLAHCRYFCTDLLPIDGVTCREHAGDASFHALVCTEGAGHIYANGVKYPTKKGDTWFIPANMGDYELDGYMQIIRATL